jgi:hypothetical protein
MVGSVSRNQRVNKNSPPLSINGEKGQSPRHDFLNAIICDSFSLKKDLVSKGEITAL